jgi:RimJ/RimL family protein N-acetyltransferase
MAGEAFDAWWNGIRIAPGRAFVAIFAQGALVGTSAYMLSDAQAGVVEIGGTWFTPSVRGAGINTRAKQMMVRAVFAAGALRLEFRVDAINARSRAAVEKLGARLDGILRSNRVTWTGRVRDTCVYSVLADEADSLPLFRA